MSAAGVEAVSRNAPATLTPMFSDVCNSFAYIDRHQRIVLTPREQQVLDHLATHADRFVPMQEIGELLYGEWYFRTSPARIIHSIRQKLGDDVIQSIVGLGYCLSEAQASRLAWRCSRCHRTVTRHGSTWHCYGCGAEGRWEAETVQLARDEIQCFHCHEVYERDRRKKNRDWQRAIDLGRKTENDPQRDFCGMGCARCQLRTDRTGKPCDGLCRRGQP